MDVKKIAERMKIVTFKLSTWGAKGKHAKETEEVNRKHGTGDAAVVSVCQCDSPLLAKIGKIHSEWRAFNDAMTRPTIQEGMRLLPLGKEFDHVEKTGIFRASHDELVDKFKLEYPLLLSQAPAKLGALFDPRRWPTNIDSKFGFEVRYMCCPTEGDWADWLQASAVAAVQNLKDELHESVKRVAERCASDGKLFDTVFTNLKDILDGIEDFDTEGVLDSIKEQIKPLADYKAEDLRKDKGLRKNIAQEADRLASIFGSLQ